MVQIKQKGVYGVEIQPPRSFLSCTCALKWRNTHRVCTCTLGWRETHRVCAAEAVACNRPPAASPRTTCSSASQPRTTWLNNHRAFTCASGWRETHRVCTCAFGWWKTHRASTCASGWRKTHRVCTCALGWRKTHRVTAVTLQIWFSERNFCFCFLFWFLQTDRGIIPRMRGLMILKWWTLAWDFPSFWHPSVGSNTPM